MRTIALTVALLTAVASPQARAEDEDAARALALELMEVTGSAATGRQAMDQLLAAMRGNPAIPEAFWDRFAELAATDSLVDLMIPIYVDRLDVPTMKAAIRFYRSPRGRALIAAMPQIQAEAMEVGQAWGRRLAEQALRDVAAGY